MIVSIIVAMDEQRGIGLRNSLPWHISADLKRFKALTMGHHILMGRKTFESINRSLPGRTMIVVSRQNGYHSEGIQVVHSLPEGLAIAERRQESEIFIIGGGQVFAQSMELANRIYLSLVHTVAGCDVFFPEYDEKSWQVTDATYQHATAQDDFDFTYKTLVRQENYA
jgi:dihydrofolate reductase